MSNQRIVNNIKKTLNDFEDGDVVDVMDIGRAMKYLYGKVRWSRCEIAGAMTKLRENFVPTGEKNEYNLNTYVVRHNV